MKQTNNEDGSYILTADAGRDLVVKDENGEVIARTKEVAIPATGTLNTWIEDLEIISPDPVDTAETDKAAKIAELEAELAKLKGAE